jgi:hypothetical protein
MQPTDLGPILHLQHPFKIKQGGSTFREPHGVSFQEAATRACTSAPRARGDGPQSRANSCIVRPCSPRTRGWSHVTGRSVPHAAPAPRARGDGPAEGTAGGLLNGCSPRTRGWSLSEQRAQAIEGLLPAHAGMVRCRSWKRPTRGTAAPRAHAGMVPPAGTGPPWPDPAPRARGMVPHLAAGRGPGCPAPRARGDGPDYRPIEHQLMDCSPRTRGWSPLGTPLAGQG